MVQSKKSKVTNQEFQYDFYGQMMYQGIQDRQSQQLARKKKHQILILSATSPHAKNLIWPSHMINTYYPPQNYIT